MALPQALAEQAGIEESDSVAPGRPQRRAALWLAIGWGAALTWWVAEHYTRLRLARALIEKEGAERGAPLTADDHVSQFPRLQADFDLLGLGQGAIAWTLTIIAFAIVGAGIAAGVVISELRSKRPVLTAMAFAWCSCVAIALANAETLSLIGWLTN